jgi:glycosyltransferase involved in cell wall biosynthesis
VPKISICLPIYNGGVFAEDALKSIAAQIFGHYVVLAGDNASTDQTADILRSWSSRLPMEVVTQSETLSMPEHFNALLDRVETE